MRVSARIAAVSVLAALSGWFVRGIQLEPNQPPSTSVPAASISHSTQTYESAPRIEPRAPVVAERGGNRNLFAYVSREVIAPPRVYHAVMQLPPLPREPEVAPAPVRPHPRFTYRYIGRFGPERNPVAAFTRDGNVITVRAGERIDAQFRLRSIGIESVEVESVVDGEARVERIAFGESA